VLEFLCVCIYGPREAVTSFSRETYTTHFISFFQCSEEQQVDVAGVYSEDGHHSEEGEYSEGDSQGEQEEDQEQE